MTRLRTTRPDDQVFPLRATSTIIGGKPFDVVSWMWKNGFLTE